jgi:uncharacterized protein (DUF111 family)
MLLLANVDDVSGELIPHAIEGLMAHGACSVHIVQAITKKGRLEYLFLIDTEKEAIEALASYLALELGTLGVRVFDPDHIKFAYRFCQVCLTMSTHDGKRQAVVDVKQVLGADGQIISVKAENDNLKEAYACLQAAGATISLTDLKRLTELVAQGQTDASLGPINASLQE